MPHPVWKDLDLAPFTVRALVRPLQSDARPSPGLALKAAQRVQGPPPPPPAGSQCPSERPAGPGHLQPLLILREGYRFCGNDPHLSLLQNTWDK